EGFLQGYLTREADARAVALDLASPRFGAVLDALRPFDCTLVMGLIETEGGRLYNTAAVIRRGVLIGRYRKRRLLAGERVFEPGDECPVFEVQGLRFGINICYDSNFPELGRDVAEAGASLIVCPANNMMPLAVAEAWKLRHNPIRGERCRET